MKKRLDRAQSGGAGHELPADMHKLGEAEMHQKGQQPRIGELDVTHYEMGNPDGPRHELEPNHSHELEPNHIHTAKAVHR